MGGNLTLVAINDSSISATVVAVSGGAASIGAAVSRNLIGYDIDGNKDAVEVLAYVKDTPIQIGGDLTQTAISRQAITAGVGAGSVGVAVGTGSGGNALALSGSGVLTENKVAAYVKAYIDGDGTGTDAGIAAGSITLKADDTSSIKATAGAASLTVSFAPSSALSLSIGVALARNEVANEIEAYIKNADDTVETTAGNIDLSATSHGRELFMLAANATDATPYVDGLNGAAVKDVDDEDTPLINEADTDAAIDLAFLTSLKAAFTAKGITLSGATADLKVTTLKSGSEWTVFDGSASYVIAKAGNVMTVYGSSIEAVSVAASVSVSVGPGAAGIALSGAGAEATNTILTDTRAFIDGSVVDSAGDVLIAAANTSAIHATVAAVSAAGGFGGTGGVGASLGVALARNQVGYAHDDTTEYDYTLDSANVAYLQAGDRVKIEYGARAGDVYEYVPSDSYTFTTASETTAVNGGDTVLFNGDVYRFVGEDGLEGINGGTVDLSDSVQDYANNSNWVEETIDFRTQDYANSALWKQVDMDKSANDVVAYIS